MNSEFLYSGRLDNLATVFCAVEALTEHATTPENMAADSDVAMICCFDHEEVGSASSHGAGSPILQDAIQRVSVALMGRKSGNGDGGDDVDDDTLVVSPERQARTIAKSFCLSIDQAHAIHPNYASKHESNHAPTLNSGIVIKTNSNQRYATNSSTGFFVVRTVFSGSSCNLCTPVNSVSLIFSL
jgi:aspartyl aminopeptidase